MDTNKFLKIQLDRLENGLGKSEISYKLDEYYIYKDMKIGSRILCQIFASIHHNLNVVFRVLNDLTLGARFSKRIKRIEVKADIIKRLVYTVKILDDMQEFLGNTKLEFNLTKSYMDKVDLLRPEFERFDGVFDISLPIIGRLELIEYYPIFNMTNGVKKKSVDNADIKMSLKSVGEGAYAKVFSFKDDFYHKKFALKRALNNLDDKEKERFHQEFKILKELDSPFIIKAYRLEESPLQYIMEYADTTLFNFINKHSDLSMDERKELVHQILEAFTYIGSKNYFHRDVSPRNILVNTYDDGKNLIKVSDFGLVKNPNNELTSVFSDAKGQYMDPNLPADGFENYDILNEIYSLTLTILFVMTGKTNVKRTKEISDSIKEFVVKGINADEAKRYNSIKSLQESFYATDWEYK